MSARRAAAASVPRSDPLPNRPENGRVDAAVFRDFCTNEAVRIRRMGLKLIEQGHRQSGFDLIDAADHLVRLAGDGLRPA
jgi:hypothetical protein